MHLHINNITELKNILNYVTKEEFNDEEANELYNNWIFISSYINDVVLVLKARKSDLLYSEYYWCTKFLQRYHQIYGSNAGFEQQQFMIIDEICRTCGSVDWNLLQKIENDEF